MIMKQFGRFYPDPAFVLLMLYGCKWKAARKKYTDSLQYHRPKECVKQINGTHKIFVDKYHRAKYNNILVFPGLYCFMTPFKAMQGATLISELFSADVGSFVSSYYFAFAKTSIIVSNWVMAMGNTIAGYKI